MAVSNGNKNRLNDCCGSLSAELLPLKGRVVCRPDGFAFQRRGVDPTARPRVFNDSNESVNYFTVKQGAFSTYSYSTVRLPY